jgi:hypothetical protein
MPQLPKINFFRNREWKINQSKKLWKKNRILKLKKEK